MQWMIAVLLILVASPVYGQLSVVAAARARHPNLPGNREVTLIAMREIAAEIGAGIYVKKSGNNCGGYSCDWICWKGNLGRDIWYDWDHTAEPRWPSMKFLENTDKLCEFPNVEQPIPNPPPANTYAELLTEIKKTNELLVIIVAQQGAIKAAIEAQTQAVIAAEDALRAEVQRGIKIRF